MMAKKFKMFTAKYNEAHIDTLFILFAPDIQINMTSHDHMRKMLGNQKGT